MAQLFFVKHPVVGMHTVRSSFQSDDPLSSKFDVFDDGWFDVIDVKIRVALLNGYGVKKITIN